MQQRSVREGLSTWQVLPHRGAFFKQSIYCVVLVRGGGRSVRPSPPAGPCRREGKGRAGSPLAPRSHLAASDMKSITFPVHSSFGGLLQRLRGPVSAATADEAGTSPCAHESGVVGSDKAVLAGACPPSPHAASGTSAGRRWAGRGRCPGNIEKSLAVEEEQCLNTNDC